MSWKCEKCDQRFERLQISWGMCNGEKVDILDYFCPNCGNTGYQDEPKIVFQGSKEDESQYWDKEWDGYK